LGSGLADFGGLAEKLETTLKGSHYYQNVELSKGQDSDGLTPIDDKRWPLLPQKKPNLAMGSLTPHPTPFLCHINLLAFETGYHMHPLLRE
jgi:hypothetical protein